MCTVIWVPRIVSSVFLKYFSPFQRMVGTHYPPVFMFMNFFAKARKGHSTIWTVIRRGKLARRGRRGKPPNFCTLFKVNFIRNNTYIKEIESLSASSSV